MMSPLSFMRLGAILMALAIALGGFGAHALKGKVSEYYLNIFQTGVTYQVYHALALMGLAYLWKSKILSQGRPLVLMTLGVLFFSGSLYLIVLSGINRFGIVTPLGGICLILSWVWVACSFHE